MELDQVMAPVGQNVERHILITIRTPALVPSSQLAQNTERRPTLNFAAVLDVSGSMGGEKLARAKDAPRLALSRLTDGDIMSLCIFSTAVDCVLEPTPFSASTRNLVLSALQEIDVREMTNLCAGLDLGIQKALTSKKETNLVLLLSDGLANVGITDIAQVGQHASVARNNGLVISTLGVGEDYNEALMGEIANAGGGRFCHVRQPDDTIKYLMTELGDVANLAARRAELRLSIPFGSLIVTLSPSYPSQQNGTEAVITVGEIPCDMEFEIPMRVTLPAQSNPSRLVFQGELTYQSPRGASQKTTLNRVTVRFLPQQQFTIRAGVAAPVAERVLARLKASSIVDVTRTQRVTPEAAAQAIEQKRTRVRHYATLLGEERAEKEESEVVVAMESVASPSPSKAAYAAAYSKTRGTRQK